MKPLPIDPDSHADFRNTDEPFFPYGVPFRRTAWHEYRLAEIVFTEGAAPAGPRAIYRLRLIAQRVNDARDWTATDLPPLRAGELLSAGLLLDIFRYIIQRYSIDQEPALLKRCTTAYETQAGKDAIGKPVGAFVRQFPPQPVVKSEASEDDFLAGRGRIQTHLDEALWEMVLLALSSENRAMRGFRELIDDRALRHEARYETLVAAIDRYCDAAPPVKGLGMTLFRTLRAPMTASPDSIEGQLQYILDRWPAILPPGLVQRLRQARDVVREETAMRGHGPGPITPLTFRRGWAGAEDAYPEPERFTQDRDWMSNVVLLAKTVHVWLDQLSKQYGREIRSLDAIPDAELDRLARWGFTGLWLIGLWERSTASEEIKRRMGNPEAAASAYSIYDYEVAQELGGRAAYEQLRGRAARRGIRLASDMVPNHVGIVSKWVFEHPERFVQSDHPPFPSYRFTGPNLSHDDRYCVQIEDGYWRHSDAAVVFKRIDLANGNVRYIYHGNDGTSMPWNDTAQLNYLLPAVREAVIQTILNVARQFPIIRFDAAMTLAKKHFQRLWFPKPGEGGAIPSRAEHSMTREEFDQHMPQEFWREVVDRIQAEAPDTLLLAEAFWLMEGYFVRTLGMHRVYNSAFMNMLKMEENEKYRTTVKNVLEFSPEVLKRFVNFMSNPDEMTAIEQFGRDDKYFGCAVLMVTMPGLPMFSHGQIEGYTEKYGMEYRRAYWDEQADARLVARHETEIFPLMRERLLFSGVERFAFYDFHAHDGYVDENVYAYSNRWGKRAVIVFFNNAYTTTHGRILASTAINRGSAEEPRYEQVSIGAELELDGADHAYVVFRDRRDGLEYIRHARQVLHEGLSVELYAYQYYVFTDFRHVYDDDGSWCALAHHLGGRGVHRIELAHREVRLSPLLDSFREMMNAEMLRLLIDRRASICEDGEIPPRFEERLRAFLREVEEYNTIAFDLDGVVEDLRGDLIALWQFEAYAESAGLNREALLYLSSGLTPERTPNPIEANGPQDEPLPSALYAQAGWVFPLTVMLMRGLGEAFVGADRAEARGDWIDEWLLEPALADALQAAGGAAPNAMETARLIRIVIEHGTRPVEGPHDARVRHLLEDEAARDYLYVNYYEGVWWVNREQLIRMTYALFFCHAVILSCDATRTPKDWAAYVAARYRECNAVLGAAAKANYQIEATLNALKAAPSPVPPLPKRDKA